MTERRFAAARLGRTAMLAASIACAGLPAPAQDMPPPAGPTDAGVAQGPHAKFDAANTTHDGRLTLAQAQAGGMRMVVRNFDAIDAGHQGYVTWPQIRAFMTARREARQQQAPAP